MAAISKDLIWRLRAAEQAFNQHYLTVLASVEGNPHKADCEMTSWGSIVHMSGSPHNNIFNRASATGPGMLNDLERIEASFESTGVRPCLEISAGDLMDQDDMDKFGNLPGLGYRPCEIEGMFYSEVTGKFTPPPDNIAVRKVKGVEDIQDFLDVYLRGWGYSESVWEEWKEAGPRLWDNNNFSAYLAFINGRAVGAAQLYLHEGVGYYSDACVLSDARRQGCQLALLDARLKVARDSKCDIVFALAAFSSQSAKNMENFGLRLATELWHWRKEIL